MPRSVNTVASRQRKKKILKKLKVISEEEKMFTQQLKMLSKALSYAYRDRKNRKRVFRSLWITRINAGAREHGLSYSELISKLSRTNLD